MESPEISIEDYPANLDEQITAIKNLIAQVTGPACCDDPGCALSRLAGALAQMAGDFAENSLALRAEAHRVREAKRRTSRLN